jgi:hypothetical protein
VSSEPTRPSGPPRQAPASDEQATLAPARRRSRSASSSSKVLQLDHTRVLLWATPRGDAVPYEVSKAVDGPLQSKCQSAPICPEESSSRGSRPADLGGWIDPGAAPTGTCPYTFETRGECIRARNVEALEAALFHRPEAGLIANYLRALGYAVRLEEIPRLRIGDGTRILNAHSKIRDTHDVRVLSAPCGELVLVRDLAGQSPLRRSLAVERARSGRSLARESGPTS